MKKDGRNGSRWADEAEGRVVGEMDNQPVGGGRWKHRTDMRKFWLQNKTNFRLKSRT